MEIADKGEQHYLPDPGFPISRHIAIIYGRNFGFVNLLFTYESFYSTSWFSFFPYFASYTCGEVNKWSSIYTWISSQPLAMLFWKLHYFVCFKMGHVFKLAAFMAVILSLYIKQFFFGLYIQLYSFFVLGKKYESRNMYAILCIS